MSDGGLPITSKGVCWSNTSSLPTISNPKTIDGSGVNSFISSITGLIPNVTYYVRAYATNSFGTAYGNTISVTTLPNLSIGQPYQGGIIGYVFVMGDPGYVTGQTHGLIVTNVNQSTGAQWGCLGSNILGTSQNIGTGLTNTNTIVTNCSTSTIAAALCFNLSFGGYSDWYLPSYSELSKLYANKAAIGGFSNVPYWSSTQNTANTAFSINFSTGIGSSATGKSSVIYVRAIRTF